MVGSRSARSGRPVRSRHCPAWCVTVHGVQAGEEDWAHLGEEVLLADGVTARLCMSVQPATGEVDGPYVLIGSRELPLGAAAELASRLVALAAEGGATPRADGTRSPGPER